jgi:uncharacterized protein DUF222
MFETTVDRLTPEEWDAEFAAIVHRCSTPGAVPGPDSPTGPQLAHALSLLRIDRLDDYRLVEALQGWARLAAWAASQQLAALAELLARRQNSPHAEDAEHVTDEVAAALAISGRAADAQVDLAAGLARLPTVGQALAAGEIDVVKARVITDGVAQLTDQAAATVAARVLARAGRQTPGQLRAAVARAALSADPAAAEERHDQQARERRVELYPLPDGIAELRATGPADQLAAVFTALDAWARKAGTDGDQRGIDARRFDALTDLAHEALAGGGLPAGQRIRPQLQVIVPVGTLLGLTDQPGELAGHGPIPASVARRIAADATWRRLLTDPASGALLDYGRTTYRPPADLAEFVMTRDRTCRFPGCRQPAHRCDLDHTVPYPTGETKPDNLCCLCRRHHRLKHETSWQIHRHPDVHIVWTSPSGHRHPVDPDAHPWPPEPDPEDAYPDDIRSA